MEKQFLYKLIIGIQAICIIAIIFDVYNLLDLKYRREEDYKKIFESYEYAQTIADRNKDFDEMVAFCENNQKEIELFSKRYISSEKPDIYSREYDELINQIVEELDSQYFFDIIAFPINIYDDEKYTNIVSYAYKNSDVCIAYVDKEKEISGMLSGDFMYECYGVERVKKINDHLYVYIVYYIGT